MAKVAEEVPETNTYQCHIQNHIRGFHVQYSGTLAPLQYFSTSYDTGKNHVYYKGGSKPQYTIMMSLQRSGSCVD